jgi:hypothetical protein
VHMPHTVWHRPDRQAAACCDTVVMTCFSDYEPVQWACSNWLAGMSTRYHWGTTGCGSRYHRVHSRARWVAARYYYIVCVVVTLLVPDRLPARPLCTASGCVHAGMCNRFEDSEQHTCDVGGGKVFGTVFVTRCSCTACVCSLTLTSCWAYGAACDCALPSGACTTT